MQSNGLNHLGKVRVITLTILSECQKLYQAVPSKTSCNFWIISFFSTFGGKENKELAIHTPQQQLSNVKITLNMVVNVPQEFERVTFTQGGKIPFLVHFSLSSNYICQQMLKP